MISGVGIDQINFSPGKITIIDPCTGVTCGANEVCVEGVCQTLDADGDGIVDADDNCPANSNSDQADRDADGLGNVCDNCPNTTNPNQDDTGGIIGVGDACDNGTNIDVDLYIPDDYQLGAGETGVIEIKAGKELYNLSGLILTFIFDTNEIDFIDIDKVGTPLANISHLISEEAEFFAISFNDGEIFDNPIAQIGDNTTLFKINIRTDQGLTEGDEIEIGSYYFSSIRSDINGSPTPRLAEFRAGKITIYGPELPHTAADVINALKIAVGISAHSDFYDVADPKGVGNINIDDIKTILYTCLTQNECQQ